MSTISTAAQTLDAYRERINSHDFDQLAGLVAPDAVFWFSNETTHRGLAAVRVAFEKTWAQLRDETYWLEDLVWIASGDTAAAATYTFHWRATIDGQPASGSGRGTTVLSRASGAWLIVHEHLSRGSGS